MGLCNYLVHLWSNRYRPANRSNRRVVQLPSLLGGLIAWRTCGGRRLKDMIASSLPSQQLVMGVGGSMIFLSYIKVHFSYVK